MIGRAVLKNGWQRAVKSLPGSLSMEGVLDRESRCHSTWQSVEAISIGCVETVPASRDQSTHGR